MKLMFLLTRRLSIQKIVLVLVIALSLFCCPPLWADAETDSKTPPAAIPYSKNLLQALAASQKSGKLMIIAFYATWCPQCRVMRNTTLKNPEVIKLAQEFEWVAIDIDRNVSLVNTYEVKAVPQFQIFDQEGIVRGKITGQSEPSEFRDQLTSLLNQIKTSGTPAPGQSPILIDSGERTEIIASKEYYRAKAICFSKVGYGPLDLPSQSPFQALRLGMNPRTPSTLGREQAEVRFRTTWVNFWAPEDPDYVFDYEQLQVNIGMAYGVSDTVQLELAFDVRSRFGGAMDSFIQGFHDLFNIDQNGRDEVPKNHPPRP